jgi:hypothetical protein
MKLEFSKQLFLKILKYRHENPSSGSRIPPCGQKDGRTDMTKLTVAFWNFANAPENVHSLTLSNTLKNFQCVIFIHVCTGIAFHVVVWLHGIYVCLKLDDCRQLGHAVVQFDTQEPKFRSKLLPTISGTFLSCTLKNTKHVSLWRCDAGALQIRRQIIRRHIPANGNIQSNWHLKVSLFRFINYCSVTSTVRNFRQ